MPNIFYEHAQMRIRIQKEDDPCGDRDCDTCEIGGCDHGIENELNPELRDRMVQNSRTPEQAQKHLEWLSWVAKDTAQNPFAQDLLKKGSWWRNEWDRTDKIARGI